MTRQKRAPTRGAGKVLYHETFDTGPGQWSTGKAAEDGIWHRNIYGQRGAPVPLEPMNSFWPLGKVTSRPLALQAGVQALSLL